MKVAIVTYSLEIGGVETVIEKLYKNLEIKGNTCCIIETDRKGIASDFFRNRGFHVKTLIPKPFELRRSYLNDLVNYLNDFDVVLINFSRVTHSIVGMLSNGIVAISIIHNDTKVIIQVGCSNLINTNKIVCVSKALQLKANIYTRKRFGNKIITIPNGVDVPDTYPKVLNNVVDLPLELIFIGRLEDTQKGCFMLLDICKVLRDKNVNFHLEIIGTGPSEIELKTEVSEYDLESCISFLGSLPHKEAMIRLSDKAALIMPSNFEGQGLVYLEAMARGVVPIVSLLKNNTDLVIDDGVNGFLCEKRNALSFANVIITISNDRNLLDKISFNAWKTAVSKLSVDSMISKYLNEISNLKSCDLLIRTNSIDKGFSGVLYFPNIIYMIKPFLSRVAKSMFKAFSK